MKTYRIAKSEKMDDFRVIGDKSKVQPALFWNLFEKAIKELTKDYPDQYDEIYKKASSHFETSQKSLTIGDMWFEIKGKD